MSTTDGELRINSSLARLDSESGCGSEWGCVSRGLAEDNETVVRIPLPTFFEGLKPCVFTHVLPSKEPGPKSVCTRYRKRQRRKQDVEECEEPGFFGELGLSLVRLVYPQARVQHLPVDGIAGLENGNDSVSLLVSGEADIVSFVAAATPDMIDHVGYTHFMRGSSLAFVMKDFNSVPPALDVQDLIQTPAGYWFLLLTLLAMKVVSKQVLIRHQFFTRPFFQATSKPLGRRQVFELWKQTWMPKAYKYLNLVISLSLGLFMAGLANYFFVVFTRKRTVFDFVSTEQELLAGLESGELRAITFSTVIYDLFLYPKAQSEVTRAYREVALYNPPIKLSGDYDSGNAYVQADALDRDPKHVWVIWEHDSHILRSRYCNLRITPDANDHNWVYDTFYRSRNFSFPFNLVHVVMYLEVRRRLMEKYFHRRQGCDLVSAPTSGVVSIGLPQLAGVFEFLLICCGAAGAACLAEVAARPSRALAAARALPACLAEVAARPSRVLAAARALPACLAEVAARPSRALAAARALPARLARLLPRPRTRPPDTA